MFWCSWLGHEWSRHIPQQLQPCYSWQMWFAPWQLHWAASLKLWANSITAVASLAHKLHVYQRPQERWVNYPLHTGTGSGTMYIHICDYKGGGHCLQTQSDLHNRNGACVKQMYMWMIKCMINVRCISPSMTNWSHLTPVAAWYSARPYRSYNYFNYANDLQC